MKKKKQEKKARSTVSISRKILTSLQKKLKEKVVNISEWRDAKITAEDFEKTIISYDNLAKLDPVHGVYAYGQNKLSVLVEQLAELPELSQLASAYADAEEEYMPSGPPMSPLTRSYFGCWGLFDLCVGTKRETFSSVAIDLCKFLGSDVGLITIFEKMLASRMGLYVHEGNSDKHVFLRELVTNKEIEAVVPTGYHGIKGEIWFARVMPPPFDTDQFNYHLVFTTPYIVGELQDRFTFLQGNEKLWLEYFERNFAETTSRDRESAYEFLMKYGLNRNFWNEYVFLAYVRHQRDMISLAGFPDIPASMPHSKQGQERFGLLTG